MSREKTSPLSTHMLLHSIRLWAPELGRSFSPHQQLGKTLIYRPDSNTGKGKCCEMSNYAPKAAAAAVLGGLLLLLPLVIARHSFHHYELPFQSWFSIHNLSGGECSVQLRGTYLKEEERERGG